MTTVVAGPSGDESRNGLWAYARGEWDVGLVNKTAAETRDLLAFFYAVAKGRLHGFRLKDAPSNDYTGTNEPIGTGDAADTTFQLIKRYTSGALTYDRIISKPVTGTVTIAFNGGNQALGWTVNTTTGVVTFASPPGAGIAITASYEFDVPVRFNTDQIKISRHDGLIFSWPSIPLVEIRDLA
jgi:uncharacterized protein (TIGR02217 family)